MTFFRYGQISVLNGMGCFHAHDLIRVRIILDAAVIILHAFVQHVREQNAVGAFEPLETNVCAKKEEERRKKRRFECSTLRSCIRVRIVSLSLRVRASLCLSSQRC